jgi:isoamylase
VPSNGLRRRSALAAFALAALSCVNSDYTALYKSSDHAPSYTTDELEALKFMGPTFVDKGVNFAVYAEHATKMQLLLFDDPESDKPTRTFEMTRFGNVWNTYVEGVGEGQAYGFVAWGPNWPYDKDWFCGSIKGFISDVDAQGNRYDPNKLLLDPYGRAINRDFDWSKGNSSTGPNRTQCDYAAAMKSILVRDHYAWGAEEQQYRANREDPTTAGHKWNDLVVYEVHAKGFTASAASGVDHPGTYLGLAEKADYFKDLGVNAVELLPVQEKPLDGGYWGYQTIGFFTPEITFSSRQLPGEPQDEFKHMVEEFHKRGIEVILDVVYNHTGEGGLWRQKVAFGGASFDPKLSDPRFYQNLDPKQVAGLYEFRGLDNAAYYALCNGQDCGGTNDPGYYSDNTGVGNETRANHLPFRHLILDSLRYWVETYHVDGFRFDLGPVLGEKDTTYSCWDKFSVQSSTLQQIIDDPVLQRWNTRVIAEPWSLNCYEIAGFPNSTNYPGDGWYEWNGPFRDTWREIVNQPTPAENTQPSIGHTEGGNSWGAGITLGGAIYGSEEIFGGSGRKPYNAMNFITIHDGFTMYDLVSYDARQNGCGPLAPDCCQPITVLCDDHPDNAQVWGSHQKNWSHFTEDDAVSCGLDSSDQANIKGCIDDRCLNVAAHPEMSDPVLQQTCVRTWCGGRDYNHYSQCATDIDNHREAMKRQAMRDFFTAMMISRGTPLLLGGDEWMKTQLGNDNAWYTRDDNEYAWFDWGAWEPDPNRQRMHDFVRQVIQFRKDHEYIFAPDDYLTAAKLQWVAADGTQTVNWTSGKTLAVDYPDKSRGPRVYVIINMDTSPVPFVLPAGEKWHTLIDTQSYYDDQVGYDGQPSYFASSGWPNTQSANITLQNPPLFVPSTKNPCNTDTGYCAMPKSIVVLQAE